MCVQRRMVGTAIVLYPVENEKNKLESGSKIEREEEKGGSRERLPC